MTRFTLITAVFLVACAAQDAAAQGFVSPFVGTTLTSPSPSGSRSKPGLGIAFGKLGKIVGLDAEIAYYPEVLDAAANGIAKNRVLIFSGDTLIGPTIGPVKVYGAFGIGEMYLNVTSLSSLITPSPDSIATNYFTLNLGGGVIGFLNPHLGVRGDLRDFRATGFSFSDLSSSGLAFNHFDFWRASVGLVAKF